ncbi:MAG: hypothetical protein CEO40_111 [Parcubacteria group bacterium LiPW_72]|nr:MAG: hypothetical protein CEO40_111 [Parcubacteria group bacterium LiPW_72]
MPKGSETKSRGKRNRARKRQYLQARGLPRGFQAKRMMQSLKRAAQEVKGTIGPSKGRTVFQLMLTKGPMYSYEESDWGKRIANTLEISQEDAKIMVREAKYGKIVLMKSEDKATLEKIQYQLISGIFGGVSSDALEIQEK